MTDKDYPNARDCEHGSLRRSCDTCFYEREISELTQERDHWKAKANHLAATRGNLKVALWDHCRRFIEAQRISCPEAIHQTDRVIEHAYAFIEGVCEIAGYYEEEEDDG